MKRYYYLTYFLCIFFFFVLVSNEVSADDYINKDLLDIESIKEEESLESKDLKWIYIFLAVLNGNVYETYAADGQADEDGDGTVTLEEPNDLEEYKKLPYQYEKQIKISDSEHISYISTMPNFEELFPSEENPIESNDMIEVSTETTFFDDNKLVGSTSIPIYNHTEGATGVERFIAFYNKDNQDDKELVTSYGFIAIQLAK